LKKAEKPGVSAWKITKKRAHKQEEKRIKGGGRKRNVETECRALLSTQPLGNGENVGIP